MNILFILAFLQLEPAIKQLAFHHINQHGLRLDSLSL